MYEGTVFAKVSPVDDIPCAESTLIEQQSHESTHVQVSSVVPDHLINLYETYITDLSASQIQKVQKLLNRYAGIFSKHDADYDRTSLIKHQIEIENVKLFKESPRRVPYHLQENNDKAIEDMLAKNVIEASSSPWAACVVVSPLGTLHVVQYFLERTATLYSLLSFNGYYFTHTWLTWAVVVVIVW